MFEQLTTELKLRNFSPRTISAYLTHNNKFLQHVNKQEETVTEDDIKIYLAYLIADKKASPRTAALVRAALKFNYDEVLKKGIVNVKTPKATKALPTILTRTEVKRLLESAKTAKSKLILMLLYSSEAKISIVSDVMIGSSLPNRL